MFGFLKNLRWFNTDGDDQGVVVTEQTAVTVEDAIPEQDTEFATEFASASTMVFDDTTVGIADKIVDVNPLPIRQGDRVTITYRGYLKDQGQDCVLHYGYGPGDWLKVQDSTMFKGTSGDYETTVQVSGSGRLAFCFHDGTGRWDNNGEENWSYIIHEQEMELR